jgi:tetratricopeptide (TPR) repeat protein
VKQRSEQASWRARLALLAIGLVVVLLAELLAGAVLALLPPSTSPDDGFSSSAPPFVRQRLPDGREMWVVHPARRHSFNEQRFPVDRPSGSMLIFCLGGSSVYGYPHGAEYAFPDRLERAMRSAYPDREIYVVNLGGMSYGSQRLELLARQLMAYRPDAVVVYTGHNEFVEQDVAPRDGVGDGLAGTVQSLRRLALYRLVERALQPLRAAQPAQTDSIFGIDVQRREIRTVQREEVARAADRLGRNLERIVRAAQANGVAVVLCTVASNLADWRPENSAMAPNLDPTAVLRLAGHLARARSLAAADDVENAVRELQAGHAVDPGYAAVSFDTARLLRLLGDHKQARELFAAARDHDPTPIRAPTAVNAAIREAAVSSGTSMVDVEREIAAAAPGGIPGHEFFLDYCHPNANGHDLIAGLLLPALQRLLRLPPEVLLDRPPTPDPDASSDEVDDGFVLWWQGNVQLRQGRPGKAERSLRRAAELKPASERPLVGLAQALKAQGRHEEAIEVARRAVDLSPLSVMALNSLGVLLGQTGRSDQAIDLLERALILDPEASWVHLNLGAEYLRRRQPDRALEYLDEAVRLQPNIRGAHRNIGLARLLRGDNEAAAEAFLAELRRNPYDLRSADRLAETAAAVGQAEIARQAAELARLLEAG